MSFILVEMLVGDERDPFINRSFYGCSQKELMSNLFKEIPDLRYRDFGSFACVEIHEGVTHEVTITYEAFEEFRDDFLYKSGTRLRALSDTINWSKGDEFMISGMDGYKGLMLFGKNKMRIPLSSFTWNSVKNLFQIIDKQE